MAEPKDKTKNIGSGKGRTRKRNEDLSSFVFGKVQPQAVPLEEAVLGALMLDKEALAVVLDILRANSFYLEAHQMIYKAMLRLFERSQPIDLLTVAEELRKTGELEAVGGPAYISELTMKVASAANIEYHARIISQKYIQRELITVSTKIIRDAFEDTTDVFQLLDDAEQGLFDIAQQNMSRGFDSMGALASKALKQMEELRTREDGLTGVPSGFTEVDRLTSGWQSSDLVILAARPGMGKCLGKGTKVVLYDGSLKNVEDVKVGDLLMGDDSTPRQVLSLARGRERMYWVRQQKGMDYRVNESHILSLKDTNGATVDLSVRDHLHQYGATGGPLKGYKVAVSFAEKPLQEAPYAMGLQIASAVAAPVLAGAAFAEKQPTTSTIDKTYLTNSINNRLELLAGLIDGTAVFTSSDRTIAFELDEPEILRQIKWLADSLGFSTQMEGSYRLIIEGKIECIPFRENPSSKQVESHLQNWRSTPITLEYDKVDDYYGFEIDGNRRFLLEDMTVTHNTSFVLSMAKNAALDFEKPVAIFSLEMSSLQLAQRIISIEAEIEGSKMRNGQLEDYEWQQLHSAIERISEVPIFIDDTPGINVFELRAKCRRLKMQHDIQMVIIDYLQLMTGGGENAKGNREQEISAISRALKGLAKELQVPVIALSQLSRAVEMRGGTKRPQLSDLRECLTGDSLIYRADTGTFEKLEYLVGQSGFQVLAMDDHLKLKPAHCLDVWETGEKEVYELTTQSGFKIKASLNHPFYTDEGWKQLVDIKEGDLVASARVITPSEKIAHLQDEEIILLAHMIGDGCFADRQPYHYTSQEPASLDIVEKCAINLWDINPRRTKDLNSKNCFHVYIPSPYHLTHGVKHPFTNLLNRVGLKKSRSHQKEIPTCIFGLENDKIALFINHLWSTDGGVHFRKDKGSSSVYYSSNSEKLIDGLKLLFLKFGIKSSIHKNQKEDYKPGYILRVTSKEDILKFHEEVGIFGSKGDKLNILVQAISGRSSNPNSDIISKKVWSRIKRSRKEKGFTERSFQSALGMQYCGSSLYKSNISIDRLSRVATILENDELHNLASSNLRWDKVISIVHIGTEKTYDIHVENHHNFVANGLIVHNSGAIEQDADIVSFIYRPEYYQILEDEEGQSLKGVAELIIAKNRHGAQKTIKLRFTDRYARFSDLDDPNFDDLPEDTIEGPFQNIITRPSKMNSDEDIPF